MKHPEDDLQRLCADWLGYKRVRAIWFHCPNGGNRNPREAARMKGFGVRPGVADFIFIWTDGVGPQVAFIELKAPGRRQSDAQLEFQADCDALEIPYAVVDSFEAFEAAFVRFGIE